MSTPPPSRSRPLLDRSLLDRPLLDRPVRRLPPLARTVAVHTLGALVLGLVAGVVWNLVTRQPGYTMGQGGHATMNEAQLTGVFTIDYWYSVIGLLVGIGQGIWAWRSVGRRGWQVVPLALGVALVAAVTAWLVGQGMGPSHFDERLRDAAPGQVVPVDFRLTSPAAVAMWPLGAILPVMFASAFLPDSDDLALRRLRRRGQQRAWGRGPGNPEAPSPQGESD